MLKVTYKIGLIVFFSEALIMIGFELFPLNLGVGVLAFLDALGLTALTAPIIYVVIVRGFVRAVEERDKEILRHIDETEAIVSTAGEAIITINGDGTIRRYNDASERLFGYGAAEVVNEKINILMPLEDRARHDGYLENYGGNAVSRAIGNGRELIGKRKDGSEFPMQLHITETPVGSSLMFTGVIRDLTQEKADAKLKERQMTELQFQKRTIEEAGAAQIHLLEDLAVAEEEVQQKNKFLREIMDNTGHGIVAFTQNLKLSAWNDTFQELMGCEDRKYEAGMTLEAFFELNTTEGAKYEKSIGEYAETLRERIENRAECNKFSWDRERGDKILNTTQRIMTDGSVINTYRDVTEERVEEDRIKNMALKDGLTGLANRRAFDAQMEEEIRRYDNQNIFFQLAYIDLDNFKRVNDTQGHGAGDEVLKFVAKTLNKHIRDEDIAVRIGGDEFAIIFRDTMSTQLATERLEVIIAEISNTKTISSYEISVGASAGIACCPGDASEVSEVIKLADEALYMAKEKGKGQVCCPQYRTSVSSAENFGS